MVRNVRRIVGENVKRIRIEADLTQAALADRVDRDRAYISGLEQGGRNPTIETLDRIAVALGVPLAALVAEV